MNTRLVLGTAVLVFATYPAFAQHPGEGRPAPQRTREMPRANQGHIPAPPPKRDAQARPEEEHHSSGHVNTTPHVNKDHWYGHDAPNDERYHTDHLYEHGHFERFGSSYRYRVERFDRDRHRFWFPGGFYFQIADWDWALAADWCWNCGDDFVVYEDSDHAGWYLLYNVHTGGYVHVMYMGT